jgi:hypothetical protein
MVSSGSPPGSMGPPPPMAYNQRPLIDLNTRILPALPTSTGDSSDIVLNSNDAYPTRMNPMQGSQRNFYPIGSLDGHSENIRLFLTNNENPYIPQQVITDVVENQTQQRANEYSRGNRRHWSLDHTYRSVRSDGESVGTGVPPSDSGYGSRSYLNASASVYSGEHAEYNSQDFQGIHERVQDMSLATPHPDPSNMEVSLEGQSFPHERVHPYQQRAPANQHICPKCGHPLKCASELKYERTLPSPSPSLPCSN